MSTSSLSSVSACVGCISRNCSIILLHLGVTSRYPSSIGMGCGTRYLSSIIARRQISFLTLKACSYPKFIISRTFVVLIMIIGFSFKLWRLLSVLCDLNNDRDDLNSRLVLLLVLRVRACLNSELKI